MSIQDLGALGEFLGLFLVLATLVYLSIQTRQAKQVAASEAARGVVADFTQIWSALSRDGEFAELTRRALNDWNSLSRTEQLRVHSFLSDVTSHFQAAFKSTYLRDLGPFLKSWEDNLLGALQTSGGSIWWDQCQFFFDPDVVRHLNARLSRPNGLPPSWTTVPWWQID